MFTFQGTQIVNPDAVLYIQQAKAIYYGECQKLTSCGLNYLSNYPVFIVCAYSILRDWVVAAKSVSFFFGFVTLIPIYLLFKRFFDQECSALGTLIFALIPLFVAKSADVIKGPVSWFFLAFGLYFFLCQIGRKNRLYLLLSSTSYLIAAWARVEIVLFILVSSLYILVAEREKKIQQCFYFIIPFVLLTFLCATGLKIFEVPLSDVCRVDEIAAKLSGPIIAYTTLRENLGELISQPGRAMVEFFLTRARRLVWFIALGALLSQMITAFFYPFFLLFITGIGGIRSKIEKDRRILYLVFLCISAFILLYLHVLQTWMISDRFLACLVLPSFVFVGFGVKKVIHFLESRFKLKAPVVVSIVCFLILAFALPKNLRVGRSDNSVFREIGESIAKREGNAHEIVVASTLRRIEWVSFYANLKYKGTTSPGKYCCSDRLVGNSYDEFVQSLKRDGISYFLWVERHWPKENVDFVSTREPNNFIKIGQWIHRDTGQLVLFKLM